MEIHDRSFRLFSAQKRKDWKEGTLVVRWLFVTERHTSNLFCLDGNVGERANFETISGSKVGYLLGEVPLPRSYVVPLLPRRASHCSLVSLTVRKFFLKILLSSVVYRWRFIRGERWRGKRRMDRRESSSGRGILSAWDRASISFSRRFPPWKMNRATNRVGMLSRMEFSIADRFENSRLSGWYFRESIEPLLAARRSLRVELAIVSASSTTQRADHLSKPLCYTLNHVLRAKAFFPTHATRSKTRISIIFHPLPSFLFDPIPQIWPRFRRFVPRARR